LLIFAKSAAKLSTSFYFSIIFRNSNNRVSLLRNGRLSHL